MMLLMVAMEAPMRSSDAQMTTGTTSCASAACSWETCPAFLGLFLFSVRNQEFRLVYAQFQWDPFHLRRVTYFTFGTLVSISQIKLWRPTLTHLRVLAEWRLWAVYCAGGGTPSAPAAPAGSDWLKRDRSVFECKTKEVCLKADWCRKTTRAVYV